MLTATIPNGFPTPNGFVVVATYVDSFDPFCHELG